MRTKAQVQKWFSQNQYHRKRADDIHPNAWKFCAIIDASLEKYQEGIEIVVDIPEEFWKQNRENVRVVTAIADLYETGGWKVTTYFSKMLGRTLIFA